MHVYEDFKSAHHRDLLRKRGKPGGSICPEGPVPPKMIRNELCITAGLSGKRLLFSVSAPKRLHSCREHSAEGTHSFRLRIK